MSVLDLFSSGFFYTRPKFSKGYISASIWSWEDFRTTASMYSFMGNPFPSDLRMSGHSIHLLEAMKAINTVLYNGKCFRNIVNLHWFSLDFIDFHWLSLIFYWFYWITPNFRLNLVTLGWCNRSIEGSNTHITFKNGFPMKKYIEAMVRNSSQFQILAEIYHFENFGRV